VVVELETIDVTEVARLVHPQDNGFQKAVEPAEQMLRRDFRKIPRADRMLYRLEQRVFADALQAA
jgi:hypothetical protein